ncbi:MAG TPA: hypothetical protein VFZ78_10945, partial [Flavisolibacter sp.]
MRRSTTLLAGCCLMLFLCLRGYSQTGCVTATNGTVLTMPCGAACTTLTVKVPNLKSTSDYSVSTRSYSPYPYVTTSGTELTALYIDDRFSQLINLPFSFCFYDSIFTKLVVGSNGVVTFDPALANTGNAWPLTVTVLPQPQAQPQPIPYAGGTAGQTSPAYYPRASIMGAYHDIDPGIGTSRRIEYSIVGASPCRKFVVSFFDVSMFSCTSMKCTQQIVLHETTGIVEVFLGNKPICASWNGGLAILGMQNWARNKAVAAPGKNCTQWSAQNEGYQFIPSGNVSRFVQAQLFTLAGTLVATSGPSDTATTTAGFLDVTFSSPVCPPSFPAKYLVKTQYQSCVPGQPNLITTDTVTISQSSNITLSATTAASCAG